MGIPIGWNIKRDESREKDVLRADVTGQRSPIRRRMRQSSSPRSPYASDTDYLVSSSRFAPHLGPPSRSSHTRTRLPRPPVPELSRADDRSNEPTRNPPALLREESSLHRSRSLLDGYMRVYQTRDSLSRSHDRPLPALTPNFAPAAASFESQRESRDLYHPRNGLSYRRASSPRLTRSRSPRRERSMRRSDSMDIMDDEQDDSANIAVSFPPLRRMGRRTIADGPLPSSSLRESWSPVSALDGLGDRERSISPLEEQLPWESFVVPDPVGPTAESSFASAAAAASFSNSHPSSRAGSSNSAASSSTHITIPSQRRSSQPNEQFMRACDTSDDDTAEDTEEEDIDVRGSIRRLNGLAAMRNRSYQSDLMSQRRRMRPSFFSFEPPQQDSERYSRRALERSAAATEYVRDFFAPHDTDLQSERTISNQLDGPAEDNSPIGDEEIPPLLSIGSSPLDQELRDARSLLERLSRREDISDDFWASVGLTRSFE
ncbi:hypothetical protein IQ07DRAFT_87221 [Pyrenochaeta sp. DS3sAY3a]|nr:hypothetical protein IQ07DRAFT_87221 [Pyrenochaeta sp. DS3sAY3a]